jgi:hypothetical protein
VESRHWQRGLGVGAGEEVDELKRDLAPEVALDAIERK